MVLSRWQTAGIALLAILQSGLAYGQASPINSNQKTEMRPVLYGFALGCIDCSPGERGRGRSGGPPVVWYRRFPHVLAVIPGSAAEQAGIRVGDVLQSIDGASVLTDSGAYRLAHATVGDRVRLGFMRDSKPVALSLVLGPVDGRKPGSGPTRIYTGYVAMQGPLGGNERGNMKLEIWSDDPMVFQGPVEDSTGGTFTLRIGIGTVIKLRMKKDSTENDDH